MQGNAVKKQPTRAAMDSQEASVSKIRIAVPKEVLWQEQRAAINPSGTTLAGSYSSTLRTRA